MGQRGTGNSLMISLDKLYFFCGKNDAEKVIGDDSGFLKRVFLLLAYN